MKKTIKILSASLLVAVLCICAVFCAFATGGAVEYTGDVETLNEYVTRAESEGAVKNMWIATTAIADYLGEKPVDPESEGYAELIARADAMALKYATETVKANAETGPRKLAEAYASGARLVARFPGITEGTAGYDEYITYYNAENILGVASDSLSLVNIAEGTARCGVALNVVNALVKACPVIEEAEGYETFLAALTEKREAYAAAVEANLAALESENSFDKYDLEVLIKDFVNNKCAAENKTDYYGFSQNVGMTLDRGAIMGYNTFSKLSDGTDDYLLLKYYKGAHEYVRTDLPEYVAGTVIEFDVTTMGFLPEYGVEIGSSSKESGGTKYFPGYGTISLDGKISAKNGDVLLEDAIVPGEWLHLSIVFDPDSGEATYYINYEYVGKSSVTGGLSGHLLHCFRIGSTNQNDADPDYDGDVAIRDFTVYEGNAIRTTDRFISMTDDERFLFYCNYLTTADPDVRSLKTSHDYARSKVSYYRGEEFLDNEAIQQALQSYAAFDYDAFMEDYSEMLLSDFHTAAQDLVNTAKTPRKLDNIGDRATLTAKLDAYQDLNDLGAYINMNDPRYLEAVGNVMLSKERIAMDEMIVDFNNVVFNFDKALGYNASIASLEKHYNKAKGLYENLDKTLIGTANFEKYTAANESYQTMEARLDTVRRNDNSKVIVNCGKFLSEYTEQMWRDEANFDDVNRFVLIVRDIVRSGAYSEEHEGVVEALAVYEPINAYYYGLLQLEHAAFISEQLDRYRATDKYFDLLGICAYITNYIEDPAKDIDLTHESILPLYEEYKIFKEELEARESDYEDVLAMNTRYFVNAVEKMNLALTYAEKKIFFDEAGLYYYNLNVSDPEAAVCIPMYEEARDLLETIRVSSEKFVESVALYELAESDDERFDALLSCYYHSQYAERTVEGVNEAFEVFAVAYENYVQETDVANAEMLAAGMLMASVSGKGGTGPILSAAFKLIFD